MTLLTNHEIFYIDDREAVEVKVPEWNKTVRLAALPAQDKAEYDSQMVNFSPDGSRNINSAGLFGRKHLLVARCALDESGKRLFTDKEAGQKSVKVISRLFDLC